MRNEIKIAFVAALLPVFFVYIAFFVVGFAVFLFLTLLAYGDARDQQTPSAQKKFTDYRRATIICAVSAAAAGLILVGIYLYLHHLLPS